MLWGVKGEEETEGTEERWSRGRKLTNGETGALKRGREGL